MRGGRQCGRHELPVAPSLNQSASRAALNQADVVLGLETNDIWGFGQSVYRSHRRTSRSTSKKGPRSSRSAPAISTQIQYQDFGAYQEVDLAIAGDGGPRCRR